MPAGVASWATGSWACFFVPMNRTGSPRATVSRTKSRAASSRWAGWARSMIWIPLRSAKMNGRILGFQRRVWWPKWTPASSSCRIETDGTGQILLFGCFRRGPRRRGPSGRRSRGRSGRHRPGRNGPRVCSVADEGDGRSGVAEGSAADPGPLRGVDGLLGQAEVATATRPDLDDHEACGRRGIDRDDVELGAANMDVQAEDRPARRPEALRHQPLRPRAPL